MHKEAVFQRIIDSINGSVQSQGVKIKFPAWMVIGSDEWNSTTDQKRAYAYQAALVTGWTNSSLIKAVCEVYEFIDEHMAKFTIQLLEDLVKEYPLEIEETYERRI
jgi:hypothetical protein